MSVELIRPATMWYSSTETSCVKLPRRVGRTPDGRLENASFVGANKVYVAELESRPDRPASERALTRELKSLLDFRVASTVASPGASL